MAVRNLYRQARPFRILGWGLFMLALLALPSTLLNSYQLIVGLLLACVGVFVLDAVRLCVRTVLHTEICDSRVMALQRLELLVVPGLLLSLDYPLALVVAVIGALVNANVALGGRKALVLSLFVSALSATLAFLLGAPSVQLVTDDSLWLAGAGLLLVFTIALADIGFRLTQKLDDHRRQWQERLAVLQPFVPQGLVRGEPELQRRWITVVMIDLVEFTSRSSPLAPEVVGTVLDDLLDAVVSKANLTGGTLDKFMGDGFLLFFPVLDTEKRKREEAVRSAHHFVRLLLDELPMLNARWQGYGVAEVLRVRVGVASGYCSLGQWGRSDVRAYTMVGTCVGLAERLQSVSAEDSLALCPVSARLLMDQPLQVSKGSARAVSMPGRFEATVCGRRLLFVSSEHTLKGFARMRVYHPSDKVRAQSN